MHRLPGVVDESHTSAVLAKMVALRRIYGNRKIVVSVDQLDWTRGIPHKLLAMKELLEQNPEWVSRLVFVQIAVPQMGEEDSMAMAELESGVHQLVTQINGRYGTLDHTPIQFINAWVDKVELCAMYSIADVAMITSLRDGFNKVAFEYVACHSLYNPKSSIGCLILSELSGAAQGLGAGALLVNPYDVPDVASTLKVLL